MSNTCLWLEKKPYASIRGDVIKFVTDRSHAFTLPFSILVNETMGTDACTSYDSAPMAFIDQSTRVSETKGGYRPSERNKQCCGGNPTRSSLFV
jgi:hypothetical protein